jgi:hypothetical protein
MTSSILDANGGSLHGDDARAIAERPSPNRIRGVETEPVSLRPARLDDLWMFERLATDPDAGGPFNWSSATAGGGT